MDCYGVTVTVWHQPSMFDTADVPELTAASGVNHLKRCHLPNPELIYRTEVLPEIAPDLVEEIR